MSNLGYLSASSLNMIGRSLQSLKYNTFIQNDRKLANLLKDPLDLIQQKATRDAINTYVLPKLTPAYQISERTLRLTPVFDLTSAIKLIHQNTNISEDLQNLDNIIMVLTHVEKYYDQHPDELTDSRYAELLKLALPVTPYDGIELPADTSVFDYYDKDFNETYTDKHIAITNIKTAINNQPVFSIQELADQHHVNEIIIKDFCRLIGLTIDDMVVDDGQIKLTEKFTRKLDEYLK